MDKENISIQRDVSAIASLALFIAGIGYFILTLAIPLINEQWHSTQLSIGLLGAAAPFGAIFGALLSGYLTDKFGRRVVLIASVIGVFIFSLLSAFSWNMTSLVALRFLLGITISANYPVAASYLAETMAVKNRGKKFCQAMFVNCLGAVAGVIASYLILCVYHDINAWRYMLALTCLPAIWAFRISLRLPESPRWLVTREKNSSNSHYGELFSKKLIKQTLLVCTTWLLMDVSYYGIGIFTPALMQSLHFNVQGDFFQQVIQLSKETVFANIFIVIGAYMAIIFIERIGRVTLQAQGFLWVTVGLLVMCASHFFITNPSVHLTCILAGFAIFNFFINAGPGATTYLIPAEVYPTHLRGKGHGFATACGKIGAALGIFVLPLLQNWIGGLLTVFIIAGTTFLGYVLTTYLGLETKDKTLEEISQKLDTPTIAV